MFGRKKKKKGKAKAAKKPSLARKETEILRYISEKGEADVIELDKYDKKGILAANRLVDKGYLETGWRDYHSGVKRFYRPKK